MKRFKRLIAIVTVLLFALSIIAPAFAQDETTTEQTSSVYDQAAKILQDKGILKGNEQGDLMLDKELTRAEILAMIIRATGQEDVVKDYVYAEQSFSDVPNTHWAFAYVEAGKDLGIVNGYPDGTFKPDRKVKFEELCKMLVAAKGESPAAGKWPLNYVRKALELGFFNGIEDEVGIGDVVIRGQAAVAFANAFFPPEKTIVVKDVKAVANDTIEVYVDAYLNNEPATLEDGDVIPLDFEIKDASDETKTVAVTLIDSQASDFGAGKLVLKTAAQTEGATYKLYYKGNDTGKTFVAVPVQLQVAKVEVPNLKQVVVTFNRDVKEDVGTNVANYIVKVGDSTKTVGAVRLSSDKKVATLILSDNLANQDKVSVTIKKDVGLTTDYTQTVGPVVDSVAPSIKSVFALTPQKIKVEFNEPINNYTDVAKYTIDGSYLVKEAKSFAEDKSIDPNVLILNLYSALSVANHSITINGVTDVAGYGVINPTWSFEVKADTSPIELKAATATLSKVTLTFNKPIANASVSLSNGEIVKVDVDGENVIIYSNNDDLTKCIPISGTNVTVTVTDYNGQSANITKYVVPTVDNERPTVKSVVVADSKTIKITFSEDVRISGTIVVKDKDGNQKVVSAIDWDKDSNGNYIYNTLKVTLASDLPAGNVTVEVSGVQDNTPLKNASLPVTVSATLADTSAPSVQAIVYKEDPSNKKTYVYIVFNKTLDATSATTLTNYKYLDSTLTLKEFSGASVSLMAGNKIVKLTIPYDSANASVWGKVAYLQIVNVADTAGNKLTIAKANNEFMVAQQVKVTGAKAVATDKIEVYLDGIINEYTRYPGDFVISAGPATISAIGSDWDATNEKLTLTLGTSINADATYTVNNVKYPLTLSLKSNTTITKDLFGDSIGIALPSYTVVDGIAPSISSVKATYDSVTNTTYVTVNFSEDVNVGSLSDDVIKAQFKVYIGGTLTAPDGIDKSDHTKIKFVFSNVDHRYKSIKVDYIPDYNANNRVKDIASTPNELAQTSVTGSW